MSRLNISIAALVVHLAVFYNIERLDFGQTNLIDMQSTIYILTLICVLLIIVVPWRSFINTYLLLGIGTALYFSVKFATILDRPIVGGLFTYLTITELIFFLTGLLLARNVTQNLIDFNEAVRRITFASLRRVKRIAEAEYDIQTEFYRSRRHRRPLSIIVIDEKLEGADARLNQAIQDAQRSMISRYVTVDLAHQISKQLRRTDVIYEHPENGKLIVLSPDTDRDVVETVRQRILVAADHVGIQISTGAASFPDEALTFETLLQAAEESLDNE
jgi:hypothetical protein